jgi:hypothetical protein
MPPRVLPSTLTIRHLPGSDPAAFQVTRLSDGKTTEPASPPSPVGFPVEGRPSSDLTRELQWYLETFLVVDSGQWLIKAIVGFHRAADPHNVRQAVRNFLVNYRDAPAADQVKLEALWKEAGLGPFPKRSA